MYQYNSIGAITFRSRSAPPEQTDGGSVDYQPGVCNIGPAEIARRRRTGYAGLAVTALLAGVLLITEADPAWMALTMIPAAGAATGFLQARWRFCANFGWRGRYNFGDLGREQRIAALENRRADRMQALRLGAYSLAGGAAATIALYLLAATL